MVAPDSLTMPIVLVARLCLGLVLLTSALSKLADLRGFVQGALAYDLLPPSAMRVLAGLLPPVELVLAIALLLGIAPPLAGSATALLLICFTVGLVVNLRRGRAIACHCGGLAGNRLISWGMAARNTGLILLAAILALLAPNAARIESWLARWRADLAMIDSWSAATLLILTLACCFVLLQLVEWAVDMQARVAQLRRQVRL
jgi:uncharacterized membrane protein YphA (DoxX/SURF4 family)